MRIVTIRRISQAFFLSFFLWFCWVTTWGEKWWQLRGWPVNLFLDLDPLVAIANVLSTHTLYRGLLWALVTVVVTLLFGRIFCGWVCPFGTLHQFFGYLGQRSRKMKARLEANRYRGAQRIKYFILLVFLAMAALPAASLQTGLLDPIPLVYRSVNLALVPLAQAPVAPRVYNGAWVIGGIFLAALALNLWIPRFYCRFVCPTGALLGLLSRFAPWRVVKTNPGCNHCGLCDKGCEGACEPDKKLRLSECVVCMNCLDRSCAKHVMSYGTTAAPEGEIAAPDLGRRGVLLALAGGALAVPMMRLSGNLGSNYSNTLVRPPASLSEAAFLERCIKCGQCMRVCPTNVIVPAGLDKGFEALWTPVLNFRSGTSGCQLNCTACGHVCPVAAIRPISLEEKTGTGKFAQAGPIRMGTAFVDRTRCLPWAMDTPCLVCQENCPVTPKAIFVKEFFSPVRFGAFTVSQVLEGDIELEGEKMKSGQYATGDYFLVAKGKRQRIVSNTENSLAVAGETGLKEGDRVQVEVRLQAPCVDLSKCIGCGVCEHECPVSGLRAIRVSAENESRNSKSSLRLERSNA